jgi:predicted NUDIX family phosphoesterase
MASKNKNEYVLVIPTEMLNQIGYFQGINVDINKYLDLINKEQLFKLRVKVEDDPNYKQIIPYVLLHHKKTLLSYRRGSLLTENRLFNNYSVGIGGHISIDDPGLFSERYEIGMKREVKEEVHINTPYNSKIIAVLNDDSNKVGKVHFGIIYTFSLKRPMVRKKEKSINDLKFVDYEYLRKNYVSYENWSKICINNIETLIND